MPYQYLLTLVFFFFLVSCDNVFEKKDSLKRKTTAEKSFLGQKDREDLVSEEKSILVDPVTDIDLNDFPIESVETETKDKISDISEEIIEETEIKKKEQGGFLNSFSSLFKKKTPDSSKKIEEKTEKKVNKRSKPELKKKKKNNKGTFSNFFGLNDRDGDGVEDKLDECPDDSEYSKLRTWFPDTDEDGSGDHDSKGLKSCQKPEKTEPEIHYSLNNNDSCPKNKALQRPMAWFPDSDHDKHGDKGSKAILRCTKDENGDSKRKYSLNNNDQCPNNSLTFKDDKDCDGKIDSEDECPLDKKYIKKTAWFTDSDHDKYGDLGSDPIMVCGSPKKQKNISYSENNQDECPKNPKTFKNDSDCDGFENDDELCPFQAERTEPAIWFVDKDGDKKGDIGGKELVFCKNPSGKKGYNYYLTATDHCPRNKKLFQKGSNCGKAIDDDYKYPIKGKLNESDLDILRERILLSLKTNDNIVGKKNSKLYLSFNKKDHMVQNILGVFYMRLGQYDKSIEIIENAIKNANDDFNKAYYSINLSEAFKKKNENEKAKKQFLYAASLAENNEDIQGLLSGRVGKDFARTYNRQKKEKFNYEVSVDVAAVYDSNIGTNENIDTNILKNYKTTRDLEGYIFPLKVSSDFVFSLKDKKDLRLSKFFSFNYNENDTFTSFNNMDFGLMGIYSYKEGKKRSFLLTNLVHGFYSYDKERNYQLSLVENQLTPSVSYKINPSNIVTGSVAIAYGNYKEVSEDPTLEKDYVSVTPNISYAFRFGKNELKGDLFYANKVASGIQHRSNSYGFKPKVSFNNILDFFNVNFSSKIARSSYSDREFDRIDNSYNFAVSLNKYFFLSQNQRLYSDVSFFYEKKKSIGYSQSKNRHDYNKKTLKLSMRYNYD